MYIQTMPDSFQVVIIKEEEGRPHYLFIISFHGHKLALLNSTLIQIHCCYCHYIKAAWMDVDYINAVVRFKKLAIVSLAVYESTVVEWLHSIHTIFRSRF